MSYPKFYRVLTAGETFTAVIAVDSANMVRTATKRGGVWQRDDAFVADLVHPGMHPEWDVVLVDNLFDQGWRDVLPR